MRVFYAAETQSHAPDFFLMRGRVAPNEERAERAFRLLDGVAKAGLTAEEPLEAGPTACATVHSPRYLEFLRTAFDDWSALPDAGPEVIANVQPRRPESGYPTGIVGRAGWHMGDLACPISRHTFRSACRAADCAVAAARCVETGASSYALTRPPGHHASREVAAGHCYLNNAAIAAEHLVRSGSRTAILDIDVHHGNGTQALFYDRADVMVVSVHGDPDALYPWFTGRSGEAGTGAGEGTNLNLPLPPGADDVAWLEAVDRGLQAIAAFGADALVLALGLDIHVSDPLGNLAVSTDGIRRAGQRITKAELPVAVIQEGGYLSDALTDNLAAFLEGLLGGRP